MLCTPLGLFATASLANAAHVLTGSGTSECAACAPSCLLCSGGVEGNCLACGSESKWPFFHQSQCLEACPGDTYVLPTGLSCGSCDSTCVSCSGPSSLQCLSCAAGKLHHLGQCLSACPTGLYASAGLCLPCSTAMAECNACSNATACAHCHSGYDLAGSSECTPSACTAAQYRVADGVSCADCAGSCGTCSSPGASNCSACDPTDYAHFYLQPASAEPEQPLGACVSACAVGSFVDGLSACRACDPTCATCAGGGASDCSSCEGGGPTPVLDDGSCITTCADGSYTQTTNVTSTSTSSLGQSVTVTAAVATCQLCDLSCATCDGPGTSECQACSAGIAPLLHAGVCVASCPNDHFTNTTQGVCLPCHSDCEECDGPAETDCLSCQPPAPQLLQTGQCVCGAGREVANGVCADLDECALDTAGCGNYSRCGNTDGGFTCTCTAGYSAFNGSSACVDVDECALGTHTCHFLATCANTDGSFTCSCNSGYEGPGWFCSDENECKAPHVDPNACEHKCVNIKCQ
ncbi:insulin-like growth factor binding protein [Pavlovales sp. CCMP2436]|nr:insulin-like growth factor binding protein [Pavlovales sp. CCMP2436]